MKKCRRQNPARRYKDAEQVKGKLLACQRAWENRKNNPGRLAWALAVLGGLLALNGLIAAGKETAYLEDIKEGRFYEAAVLFPQREEASSICWRKEFEGERRKKPSVRSKG